MADPPGFPARPGVYALVFRVDRERTVRVGRLGRLRLVPGTYVYVGSAHGPGGIAGRLRHHLRPVRRPRWHVDYLRRGATLLDVGWALAPRSAEHRWARALAALPGAVVPLPGFGASDCRCAGHLIRIPTPSSGSSGPPGSPRSARPASRTSSPCLSR